MEDMSPNPFCFFCIMKETNSLLRRSRMSKYFQEMPLKHSHEHVVVLSTIWHIAMTKPNDPEYPSLGIFECMANLIQRGINDNDWLLKDQSIYIPYYAAHIIGSYTMNKVEFAEKAVQSGVVLPLLELLRGKITWIEQRVAVRALGHLASYEKTFEAVAADHEDEIVKLAMNLASSCLDVVYTSFVGVIDVKFRLKYHSDLLTRGNGGIEMENKKAEEWASQIQCWSIHLLNCFASKERSLNLICNPEFLKNLCNMWGGLVNYSSPAGVGLIRILCYNKTGRKSIAESREVLLNLCNLSRSSDDWQYIGIDCLLLLLRDPETRYKVFEIAALFLIDLVEITSLGDRTNLGKTITQTLLLDYKRRRFIFKDKKVQKALQEIWGLKIEKKRREKLLSEEKLEERRVVVILIKQQANHMFNLGELREALRNYSEALDLCPLRFRKERMVLYSNRAQCYLLLRDADSAISDSTRALCYSNPANSHGKSLWRRSQAYDMKGLAKESLMDCIMFVNSFVKSGTTKIPYYATRMINKQMNATWIFASAISKSTTSQVKEVEEYSKGECESSNYEHRKMTMMGDRVYKSGTSKFDHFIFDK